MLQAINPRLSPFPPLPLFPPFSLVPLLSPLSLVSLIPPLQPFPPVSLFAPFPLVAPLSPVPPISRLGLQPDSLAGGRVFVLPNPSGRNAHYSYGEMLESYRALKRFLG